MKPLHKLVIRPLDKGLASLRDKVAKRQHSLTSEDIHKVLRKYSTVSILKTCARWSAQISSNDGPEYYRRLVYTDPISGGRIAHSDLAFIAANAILAGPKDTRSRNFDSTQYKDDLLLLCSLVNNGLPEPFIADVLKHGAESAFQSLIVRADWEQFEYQFDGFSASARSIYLLKIVDDKRSRHPILGNLGEFFVSERGITLSQYFALGILIRRLLHERQLFDVRWIWNRIQQLGFCDVSEDSVSRFVKTLSISYREFNSLLHEHESRFGKTPKRYAKTRFNPLRVKPIIVCDSPSETGESNRVVPSYLDFVRAIADGLYWWFVEAYRSRGEHGIFQKYFGDLFEEYVGDLLKEIYGKDSVLHEPPYGQDRKLGDWVVETTEALYIYEVKSAQIPVSLRQTGNMTELLEEENKRISQAVMQVLQRASEIWQFEELRRFRDKEIVAIVVTRDFPMVSGRSWSELVDNATSELRTRYPKARIDTIPAYVLTIDEIEQFGCFVPPRNLKEILENASQKSHTNISSQLMALPGERNKNPLLLKAFAEVCHDLWAMRSNAKTSSKEEFVSSIVTRFR